MIGTYKARKRCLIADRWREYGELVPEAHTWRLVESEISMGSIERTTAAERDFSEAVQRFCPEMGEEIFASLGLGTYDPNSAPAADASASTDDATDDGDAGDEDDAGKPKQVHPRGRSKAPVLITAPEPLEG